MSETLTQTPADEFSSKFSSLMGDSSDSVESTDNSTENVGEKTPVADRGTQPLDNNGADDDLAEANDSKAKTQTVNASNSSPEKNVAQQSNIAPPKKTRSQERLEELLEYKKKSDAKLAELEAQLKLLTGQGGSEQKKPSIPTIVPPPQKPSYSKEQLNQAKLQIQSKFKDGTATEHDQEVLEAINEQLQGWKDYEFKNEIWDLKNGQAFKERESQKNFYRQEAAKKWPALKDSNSPHFQEIGRVQGMLKQNFGEELFNQFMETPSGEWFLADLADVIMKGRTHGEELGALKKQIEEKDKELVELRKKMAPSIPSDAQEVEKESKTDSDPGDEFSKKFRELKRARGKIFQ